MKELLKELQEARTEKQKLYEEYTKLRDLEISIKDQIIELMNKQGLESARYNDVTATVAHRETLKVIDEKKLVKYLKSMNLDDYVSERPNELFEVYRKEAEKQHKVVPGTELQETEYLNVREKKEK